ncbi:uncharacterized protein AB675_7447 [Cyphellophora attinorum]|uniref:Uncharacterized protein n=1 Tax=Cyphellophora attinorum TaxID=1664694 RepID=A0A0N1P1B0_9EURO|nr:uncharacterized protein AB675_7447 [Phialophora attinorum]KPI40367.1 hypothetical protein AB675_7447 [Phialophora attinorum]
MSKQPAVVAIARHGARLDASDRAWRDKADKPYDTPLSYGGWRQCQILGARIASELKLLDASRKADGQELPQKRRRIIVHCSPYLRCLQTAIAISAGLQEADSQAGNLPAVLRDGLVLDTRTKEGDENQGTEAAISRPLLRLDCFLEEWRSASYFEKSMPPAPSRVLLAAAKEMLQQPAEEIKGTDLASPAVNWVTAVDREANTVEDVTTSGQPGLRQQISKRARHLSDIPSVNGPIFFQPRLRGYTPPTPKYALAPSDPIPVGFVAHARDACLRVDYDWDSTREWGDGGVWDEEWGSMHRRVGSGLEELVRYYNKEEDDTVVILVTHQACCNALIRRLTGAPALHDIGTASLTLAIRRDEQSPTAESPTSSRRSVDGHISQQYEMKIIASTEHLRGGSNPLGLNSPRLGRSPAFAGRRAVGADSAEGFTLGDPWRHHPMSRSLSHRTSEADVEPLMADGLWAAGIQERAHVGTAIGDELEKQLRDDGERSLPVRAATQNTGMWVGASRRGSNIVRERSPGKRRWTAVDTSP